MTKKITLVTSLLILLPCFYYAYSKHPGKDYNVVLITIDALRADHLSAYGYERETAPFIDQIAKDGIIFTNAYTPASWTSPAMASLFTAYYPQTHNVGYIYGMRLNESFNTLAEVLSKQGFSTAGFSQNPFLSKSFGFHQGFDTFLNTNKISQKAIEWLGGQNKKFFLWVHYLAPHTPYVPREPYYSQYRKGSPPNLEPTTTAMLYKLMANKEQVGAQVVDNMRDQYDSEINYADNEVKGLLAFLSDQKKYDNTLVIITSDHGEAFYEHQDFLHGNTVYDEIIKIPLIIKFPKNYTSNKAKKVAAPVSLIDIKPTISEFIGDNSKNSQGISLLGLVKNNTTKRKFLISQQEYWNGYRPIAIYTEKLKMIYFASYGKHSDNFKYEYFQQQYEAVGQTAKDNPVKQDADNDSGISAYLLQLKKEVKENELKIGNKDDYFVLYSSASDRVALDPGAIEYKKDIDYFIAELKSWTGQQKSNFDLSQNEIIEDKAIRKKIKELGYAR